MTGGRRTVLDDLERGLIHALRIDGRAPFRRIAAVLGVSPQAVTRRYQRLRAESGLRVVGLPGPRRAGQARWLARVTASPVATQELGRALAQRADTSWVALTSGGTEVVAIIHTPTAAANPDALLLHGIPRSSGITSVSAHYLLHSYLGGATAWHGRAGVLTEEQQLTLRTRLPAPGGFPAARQELVAADGALLGALGRDGRASCADLAAITGWSPWTVARRIAALQAGGAIRFDVEVSPALVGVTTEALLWMAVAPAHLDTVARALAGHEELVFVAATTGPTNLVAHALCRHPEALHRYLTHRLGGLDAIRAVETAPVLRTVTAAAAIGPFGAASAAMAPRRHAADT